MKVEISGDLLINLGDPREADFVIVQQPVKLSDGGGGRVIDGMWRFQFAPRCHGCGTIPDLWRFPEGFHLQVFMGGDAWVECDNCHEKTKTELQRQAYDADPVWPIIGQGEVTITGMWVDGVRCQHCDRPLAYMADEGWIHIAGDGRKYCHPGAPDSTQAEPHGFAP